MQLVGEGGAYAVLYVALLGQQLTDTSGVAVALLQGFQFAPQWCQSLVVTVIYIKVCDARMVGIQQGEHLAGVGQ